MELGGRRVLVTGASKGIGAALAEEFSSAGARLALVARGADALQELARRFGGAAYVADLADRHQVRGLVDRIAVDGGPLDVLVNNAGVEVAGNLVDQEEDDIEALYRLNLLTPVELCRQVLPDMLTRRRGHIVNVSSLAAVSAFPGLAAYSSSKAALSHFTAGLRADLRGGPVGTTLVELGPVSTGMLDRVMTYPPSHESFERMYQLKLLADIPPRQAARAVVAAVRTGRRHVRLPRRAAFATQLVEAPRRTAEWLLTGVPHQSRG